MVFPEVKQAVFELSKKVVIQGMRRGIKRFFLVFFLLAVPMVSAQPISISQGTVTPSFHEILKSPLGEILWGHFRAPGLLWGVASWYSETDPGINRHTANGEVFEDTALTCASWNFPFGTYLQVTNSANGKSVICRVNDRGPAKRLHRLIDLTKAAFRKIADAKRGLIRVSVTPVAMHARPLP